MYRYGAEDRLGLEQQQ